MLDLNAIRRRAATRANAANPANAANWLMPDGRTEAAISQLATVATLASNSEAQSGPYRLTQADADAAHAEPWDDAAIGRFVGRVTLFLRRGIDATDADDLAEQLHLRDLQADDRRLCLECSYVSGRAGTRRCGSAAAAGVGRELPETLVTQLQRCPGFAP